MENSDVTDLKVAADTDMGPRLQSKGGKGGSMCSKNKEKNIKHRSANQIQIQIQNLAKHASAQKRY
jgi:hypothetical protein